MDPRDFGPKSPGRLVRTIEGQWAFVPANLPPSLDLGAVAISMAEAMQAIGELKGACRRLQNPYILVRPLQRREALTSSAMEGTFTTDDSLLLAEAGIESAGDENTREVTNYVRALDQCLKMLDDLPLSHRVLRQAHAILLSGLSPQRGARKRPGEYKQDQNWIGGRTIDTARFIPPPPRESQQCMDALERYLNRSDNPHPPYLVDLGLVHYQLEAIHPFADGNGRVGRMLISLMAVHGGLLETPALYVSPALEQRRDDYIDLLYGVSVHGAWSEWLNFFFDRVRESCAETVATVDRLIELHDRYRGAAGHAGRSANAIALVDMLFERPVTTVRQAANRLGVTYAAARGTIDKLIGLDILRELPGTYPKVFFAPEINAVARPPAPLKPA